MCRVDQHNKRHQRIKEDGIKTMNTKDYQWATSARVFSHPRSPTSFQREQVVKIPSPLTLTRTCHGVPSSQSRGTPTEDLHKICTKLHNDFPQLSAPLETLLILDMDSYICHVGTWPVADTGFIERLEILGSIDNDSGVLRVAKGVMSLIRRNFMAAREQLTHGCELRPELVCCQFYLTWTLHLLHRNFEAIDRAKCCLNLLCEKKRTLTVKSSHVEEGINLLLAKVYLEIGTVSALSTAMDHLKKLGTTDESLKTEVEGYILLQQGQVTEAQEKVASLGEGTEKWALQGWVYYHDKQYQDATDSLIKAVEGKPERSNYGVMYSKALWEIWKQNRDTSIAQKCFSTLLKTAKQDPYHTEVFEMLGYFYRDIQKDRVRSRKCFEKSFDLDGSNERSGAALCDMLTDDGNEDEAFVLLKRVTSTASAGSSKWAWLRYGLHQMKHDSLSSAVSSLQSAVRADPNDSHVWECLAEAYLHRGSFTAALKAFTKVIELNPESLYSLYKIASIKQKLGTFKEAIEEYKVILEKSVNFVPALKGIGETYLLLANHQITNVRDNRAIDSCQEALMYLTRAASHRPDLSCLWKMMGDAATLCHSMDPSSFIMMVPDKLLGKASEAECTVNLHQCLQIGARCYGKALDLLPQCASLWHDLGINLYYQSHVCSTDTRSDISQKSYSCLKQAVTLDPDNYRHWNAFGVTLSSENLPNYNPKLAQHCFIKSIQAEQNNVVAWTNLATLYLKAGNVQLAHEAYKVSQSLEPSYVACWVGQAIIAETVGDQDAMDLFRHTTELGNHIESAIGYGHWVCAMLQDTSKHNTELYQYAVHHMKAIPAATDALSHYLDRKKTDATAYNLHGLLLEQQGLVRSAAEAWKKSLSLMESNGADDKQIQKVRINLARVLSKLGQYLEALSLYKKCSQDNFTALDVCYLGLLLHKASDKEKAMLG
ncbi:hypothetical protein FSP39_020503 [Pinctada imbricata]|uniref:Tetratricopeptide repeat protein 37 n=1 Tax=Pinctada imbricata TaxID=66713 RepID=A0AA88YB19_PINIB|nr:hypothetical protein FSP39_020503 [Pinctada imbricata]